MSTRRFLLCSRQLATDRKRGLEVSKGPVSVAEAAPPVNIRGFGDFLAQSPFSGMDKGHRFAIVASLVAFCCSVCFTLISLASNYWAEADVIDSRKYRMSGYLHTGIFFGERDIDWGHGAISTEFSVFSELQDGTSFFSRTMWIFALFFVTLSFIWSVVGIITCILSLTALREETSIAGPNGIYLWSLLSSISLGAFLALFYSQYHTSLKNGMLLSEHIAAGFTTLGQCSLGYAFYLMLCSLCCLYLPPLVMVLFTEKIGSRRKNLTNFDPTLMLY
ncbi:unnamed protein product [Caenorhabditis auriculariae]|uniref:Uncharacterized protein n=1 Tax=Caenorhabditis auriculariae TaxID=2777116 RepID=A0A8S1HCJ1_9PELO|nr:unnamed protein product [Caenorhabditis auriculariae]